MVEEGKGNEVKAGEGEAKVEEGKGSEVKAAGEGEAMVEEM